MVERFDRAARRRAQRGGRGGPAATSRCRAPSRSRRGARREPACRWPTMRMSPTGSSGRWRSSRTRRIGPGGCRSPRDSSRSGTATIFRRCRRPARAAPDLRAVPSRACGSVSTPARRWPTRSRPGNLRRSFVVGGNVALNLPNHPRLVAALRRLEVLVVADVVTTETTDLATHVWPCTGQLERCDLTVIHDVLMPSVMCQYTGAVLAPAAERRPMWWAFAELGRRIGVDVFPDLDLGTASDDDALELALQGARLGLDDLRRAGEAGQPVETDRAVFGWVHRACAARRSLAARAARARAATRRGAPPGAAGTHPATSGATPEHAAPPVGRPTVRPDQSGRRRRSRHRGWRSGSG